MQKGLLEDVLILFSGQGLQVVLPSALTAIYVPEPQVPAGLYQSCVNNKHIHSNEQTKQGHQLKTKDY